MNTWGRVVVKPKRGEQVQGITIDVRSEEELKTAIDKAAAYSGEVILEEFVEGNDLRIIVIDHEFVAAIERKPASVIGNGVASIKQLVDNRNMELLDQTRGESQIPVHGETERVIKHQGYAWEDVLEDGKILQVCKTANYHTGGTISDVTDQVSPFLREVAERTSRVLDIPVVGFDFIVPDFSGEEYVIIEANERPGLANHEPQPAAERFIDFLFPETKDK